MLTKHSHLCLHYGNKLTNNMCVTNVTMPPSDSSLITEVIGQVS